MSDENSSIADAPPIHPSEGIPLTRLPGGERIIDLRRLLGKHHTRLPIVLRIVAENLARQAAQSPNVDHADLVRLAEWTAQSGELSVPLAVSRLVLPDSSGLPLLMDLAAARDAVNEAGGDALRIQPAIPAALVVDHSLMVDVAGRPDAAAINLRKEYHRNGERYAFFKWAAQAFRGIEVFPPGTGIIHQVHLEQIARVVAAHRLDDGTSLIAPEFVLGCDSHTPMVGGIGLLAWGVGGVDGEAALLGHPYHVRIPKVTGVRLSGQLPPSSTPTDLVLTITQRLREVGVIGAFVEFFGPGLANLTVPDRATIANMAPEYGATCAYFPIDAATVRYLQLTGRTPAHIAMVAQAAATLGIRAEDAPGPESYSQVIDIDLGRIGASIAGPKRPQDRLDLAEAGRRFRAALERPTGPDGFGIDGGARDSSFVIEIDGKPTTLRHGALAIAAITACTNTSNPTVMIAAGLLARNAVARGLRVPAHVKTSLAPGSRTVTSYLGAAGLLAPLETLGFHVVGYGCTTCSGKSGPIAVEIDRALRDGGLVGAAVLSGNRNFEGRIHPAIRAAYLASPPLVIAFALAGRVDLDLTRDPLGTDPDGVPIYLRDLWPDAREVEAVLAQQVTSSVYAQTSAAGTEGARLWEALPAVSGPRFDWDPRSTYIRRPPFFEPLQTRPLPDRIAGLRVLVSAGDSLTTDHITPSGAIQPQSEAGRYLLAQGVAERDFNAVTQRRGNHDFMARVTYANPRLRNALAEGAEGGVTKMEPNGPLMSIHAAAERYRTEGTPLMVLAGRDCGMGSSRDWAAKGPALLGVRVVLAESFERIHRANLIGLGIVPLLYPPGEGTASLGLTGFETMTVEGLAAALDRGGPVVVTAERGPRRQSFEARLDIASRHEANLLAAGGIFAEMLS